MGKIKVLFDTNIILDWLLKREDFFQNSFECIQLCNKEIIEGYITPHSISDIFYLISKKYSGTEKKEYINLLCNLFYILSEDSTVLEKIITSENWKNDIWNDIEDSMQIVAAEVGNLDYILTRNIKDFRNTKIKCILPENLLQRI